MSKNTAKLFPMTPDNKRELLRTIDMIPADGTLWRGLLERARVTRSNAANAYYHGVVVRSLQEFLAAQGESYTHDDVHELFKCKHLLRDVVNPETGEVVGRAPRSTASLDSVEFGEFLDRCIDWLQTMFGITVPAPGEYGVPPTERRGRQIPYRPAPALT